LQNVVVVDVGEEEEDSFVPTLSHSLTHSLCAMSLAHNVVPFNQKASAAAVQTFPVQLLMNIVSCNCYAFMGTSIHFESGSTAQSCEREFPSHIKLKAEEF